MSRIIKINERKDMFNGLADKEIIQLLMSIIETHLDDSEEIINHTLHNYWKYKFESL